jgi:hypothetical protein
MSNAGDFRCSSAPIASQAMFELLHVDLLDMQSVSLCRVFASQSRNIKLRSVFMKIRSARTPHNQTLQFPLRIRPSGSQSGLEEIGKSYGVLRELFPRRGLRGPSDADPRAGIQEGPA